MICTVKFSGPETHRKVCFKRFKFPQPPIPPSTPSYSDLLEKTLLFGVTYQALTKSPVFENACTIHEMLLELTRHRCAEP